jgi:hypothetical protein
MGIGARMIIEIAREALFPPGEEENNPRPGSIYG